MTYIQSLTALLAAGAIAAVTAQQPPAQQPPPDQAVRTTISGSADGPPKLAVPEFIPLTKDADVVSAAKTIGDVLWDDFAFEKEFYMLPRDILRTVPRPASADQVAVERWRELGADAVVVGTVTKTADKKIVVEVRLIKVATNEIAAGKQYGGSERSLDRRRQDLRPLVRRRSAQDAAQSPRRRPHEAGVLVRSRRRADEGAGRPSATSRASTSPTTTAPTSRS